MTFQQKCPKCGDVSKCKMADEDAAFLAGDPSGIIKCKCRLCSTEFVLDDEYTRTIREFAEMVIYHGR